MNLQKNAVCAVCNHKRNDSTNTWDADAENKLVINRGGGGG